jgi:hypothetical protein
LPAMFDEGNKQGLGTWVPPTWMVRFHFPHEKQTEKHHTTRGGFVMFQSHSQTDP